MNWLLQSIGAHAKTSPSATAVRFKSESLDYGELEAASNRLAHLLIDMGCRRGARVALLMPKQPMAIVGMLAVLKTGGAYVPLDPAGPASRLARMMESSDCQILLAAGPVGSMLQDVLSSARLERMPAIGWLQDDIPETQSLPAAVFSLKDTHSSPGTPPTCVSADADLAHILFTSGSTGKPKGVMISCGNVAAFIRWAIRYFGIGPDDRVSQHSPLHFDLSTFDIYGALCSGAEVNLVPSEFNLLPHKLAQFIRDSHLTQWFSVPSVLNLMSSYGAVGQNDFSELRRVMWCGEAIPAATLMKWMRHLPHVQFTNLYGPTEATIASSYYTVPRPTGEHAVVPIGRPCEGEELLVLDKELQPCPPGETGDLYILGAGLSPGYWRDQEKTESAFLHYKTEAGLPDRMYKTGDIARLGTDGLVYFLGRADTQIKSRGYRIELGEIEAAANAIGCVAECAVVAIPSNGFEGTSICCAFSMPPGLEVPISDLIRQLRSLLPAYMIPGRWQALKELPKNANGKIDRPALRQLFLDSEGAITRSDTGVST